MIKKQASAYSASKKRQPEKLLGCVANEFTRNHLAILLHHDLGLPGAVDIKQRPERLQLLAQEKPFSPVGEHLCSKNLCSHIHHHASW